VTSDGYGRRLGGVRDLAHDLDDVTVGVENPELPVGARPAGDDLPDALELPLRAELAGVRLELWTIPSELIEPRPIGPPFTHDDLIDFHEMLAAKGWFDELLAAHRRRL